MEQLEWSASILSKMHIKGLTGIQLAELTGYTNEYISMTFHGKKPLADAARKKIENAVENYKPSI